MFQSSSKDMNPFSRPRSPSPPPLAAYSQSQKRKHRPSRPRSGFSDLIKSKLSSNLPRFVLLVLAILLLLLVIYLLSNNALVEFRFKIHSNLVSAGWIGLGLKLRKQPLIFVHSSQSAAVVWESNKVATTSGHQLGLRYWTVASGHFNQSSAEPDLALKLATGKLANVKRTRPEGDDGKRRWVHSALLEDLTPGTTYAYEIVLLNSHPGPKHGSFDSVKKTYASHQFTWLGIDPPDSAQLGHLSATSPSSKDPIDLIHIVVVGDNQLGVRVFRKLAARFTRIQSYVAPLKSIFGPRQIIHHHYPLPTKPSLLFHLGDAVQDVHNLKHWQTDFWDPLTFKNPLMSQVPIVYVRGNHDFDPTGRSFYTGGLAKVQVGEMNRTATAKLRANAPLEFPGIREADQSFTTFKIHERDSRSRGTYHAYSPHPRVRVVVCDSNLEPARVAYPGAAMSEVDEHERWLLWEMGRPEWKQASIRIVLVHVPPFVEYWEKAVWTQGESEWSAYVRTRFAAHFHGVSAQTIKFNIPPASLVISGHSHTYSRGMLSNLFADAFFHPPWSAEIPEQIRNAAKAENQHVNDATKPRKDHGVVYVVSGGGGGMLDTERVESWGFYERSIAGKHHFGHMMLDMSPTLLSVDEWRADWQDSRNKWIEYGKDKVRVYRLLGSQMACRGIHDSWEAGHYWAIDRLVWTTFGEDETILDRFVIEADSCQ